MENFTPAKIIILSRDELKQHNMQVDPYFNKHLSVLRFFLGDVRDYDRLLDAFDGVDVLFHAAALKQVPALEYNPFEAVKTNIIGANNIIRACNVCKVKKVIALSTDKAASPMNLYGATKLCQDKLMVASNFMYPRGPDVAVVRYGNVFGSRGSVVPVFLKMKDAGFLNVTDDQMTRFSITLPQGIAFVLNCLRTMEGGEIFIPCIPSYNLMTLAKTLAPSAQINITGIRPGEKMHEVMVPGDEALNTLKVFNTVADGGNDGKTSTQERYYIITPTADWFDKKRKVLLERDGTSVCEQDYCYSSGKNTEWLDEASILDCLEAYVDGA